MMRIGKDRTNRLAAVLVGFCIAVSGAARADNRPLANVTLNGQADLGVVSPGQTSESVLLTAFAPDPPGEMRMIPPPGQVIPDLGLSFNWNGATITKTKLNAATNVYSGDGAQNGTVSLTPAGNTPDGGQHANLSASFPDPGQYHIAVSVSGQWWAGTGDYYVGTSNIITLSLTVVDAAISIRRRGAGAYSESATLAAGQKASDEHNGDLLLQTIPAVAGLSFGDLTITSGGQGAANTLNASASWNKAPGAAQAVTDANGRISGSFVSGNRVEPTTLSLVLGPNTTRTLTATQVWNELEGDESAWTYEPYYTIGTATPITYTITFDGGVPITGHALSFLPKSIEGWEWNATKPVDEDGDGVTDYFGDYDVDVTYTQADSKLQAPSGVYSGLVAFSTPTSEGTGADAGKYSTGMTVNDLLNAQGEVDFYTDNVVPGIQDTSILIRTSNE